MRRVTDYKLAYWKKALDTIGDHPIIANEADDLATQQSLLISPRMYKELVHPYHKELFQFIHSYAKGEVFVFYHSCGACKPLIPYLIEEGVNILNPVQVSAKEMDTAVLKREFGKDLTFWGGGVDTQRILPFGTEEDVREEVKRRIDDLRQGGGFVFAAIHNVQSDVPANNFLAMLETLQAYG
jgi:uroporphyrinogen decarboxylase